MTEAARRQSRTPPAPSPRLLIGLTMLAVAVAQSFGRFTYGVLLPAVEDDLLGSYAMAGLAGTVNVGAYLAGTGVVAAVATRTEPARLVKIGLAGSTTGLAVLTVAPNTAVFLAGMLVTGLSGALIWVPAPGLVSAAVPPARRGLAMGMVSMGIGLGILFASQLAAFVRSAGDAAAWRPVWAVEAAIGAVAVLSALRWLRPPPTPAAPVRLRLSTLRLVPGWRALTVAYAAFGLAYSLFVNYLVAALEDDAGFSAGHASAVFSAMGIATIVGGVLLGRLSDHAGRRPTMTGGFAAMGASAVLVLAGAEPWATVAAVMFGLVFAGLPVLIAAHIADTLDARSFGAAFGAVTLAFGVAQLIGPQLGGWIGDTAGSFTIAFLVSAATAAAGAVASAALPRRTPAPNP